MITIIDYGMGNLRSVQKALEALGATALISADPEDILKADSLILPGVGSFGAAMKNIVEQKLKQPIVDFIKTGKPFLGICLGLQLLFEFSEETPDRAGLGIIKGSVKKISSNLRVPHMGWNQLKFKQKGSPLLSNISENSFVYFVHSYYVEPLEPGINLTTTDYGIEFTSAIQKDNIVATQFHPEKSGAVGQQILRNFIQA